jgi:hypothetical protein
MGKSKVEQLREEIFTVTGVAVVQLQLLEYYISGCMVFVWKGKSQELMGDLLSSNPKRRGETIGRMLSVLRKTIRLEPDFDKRLSTFIENRNRLIHRLFQDLARFGAPPPQEELENAKRFILELILETRKLQKVFLGFFSVIGNKLKETNKEGERPMNLEFLTKYEEEFYSAFGSIPREPDGV